VCLVVALDGGFIGVTAVDGDRLRQPVAADGFFQKPERGLFIPVLCQEKVNRLALLIDRSIELPPLALHLDIGLVHPPVHPHRTLAPMKRLLELGALFDDPSINGGVIHLHPALLHEFFDVARAQRVRQVPTNPHENDL